MALLEEFQESVDKAKAKSLPPTTKDSDKLILYGLYKQATEGNVNANRQGIFSPRERAKWDAWKAVEGKAKEEAMTEYIARVKELRGVAATRVTNLSSQVQFCYCNQFPSSSYRN